MERNERDLVTGFANRPHRFVCVKKTDAEDQVAALCKQGHGIPVHTGLHRAKPTLRHASGDIASLDVIGVNCDVRWHDEGLWATGRDAEASERFPGLCGTAGVGFFLGASVPGSALGPRRRGRV